MATFLPATQLGFFVVSFDCSSSNSSTPVSTCGGKAAAAAASVKVSSLVSSRVGKSGASGRLPCAAAAAGGGGAAASADDEDAAAPEVDVSVMSFTLGIPGFDDSELPRLLGILFGSCIVLNHVLSRGLISGAQLRSEVVGMFLSAVTIALPDIGRRLKGGGGESANFSSNGVGQTSMFAFADTLTDRQKQELAWGSYALLRNTKTSAVLVWQDECVVCARGSWDVASDDGAMALALLGTKLGNTPALQMSDTLYISNGADATKGWEVVVPKGATCLFLQPVVEPNNDNRTIARTGLVVISSLPRAFSSKDRLWFTLLAKKFSQTLTI